MKDTTDFINLIENMHISNNVVLGTLDVSYLYTNIPQTEGIDIICHHYEKRYEHNLPISTNDYGNFYSTHSKNYFKFNERHFIQTQGVAMGTKRAVKITVAFSVIFKADREK